MKYLFILSFIISFIIYPKDNLKIYVNNLNYSDIELEKFEKKFRGTITDKIIQNYSNKYTIMDEDSIQTLKEKLKKKKEMGCDEEDCITEINNSIDADEIISGEISKKNKLYNINIKNTKKNRKNNQMDIKSLVTIEFSENQMDYYSGEIVNKLLNPSYVINKKGAPLSETDLEVDYSTISELKPIPIPKVSQLTASSSLLNTNIKDSENLALKGEYMQAIYILRDSLELISVSGSVDKKNQEEIKLAIENNIRLYAERHFAIRIEYLNTQEKKILPHTIQSLESEKGIKAWENLLINYNSNLRDSEKSQATQKLISSKILQMKTDLKILQSKEYLSNGKKLALKQKYTDAYTEYKSAQLNLEKKDQALEQEIISQIKLLQSQKLSSINKKSEIMKFRDKSDYEELISDWKELKKISEDNNELISLSEKSLKDINILKIDFIIAKSEVEIDKLNSKKRILEIKSIYNQLINNLKFEYEEYKYKEIKDKIDIYMVKEKNLEQEIIKSIIDEIEVNLIADNVEGGRLDYNDKYFRRAVGNMDKLTDYRSTFKSNLFQQEENSLKNIINKRIYGFNFFQSFSYNKHCLTPACSYPLDNKRALWYIPSNFIGRLLLLPNADRDKIFYSFYFSLLAHAFFQNRYLNYLSEFNQTKNDPLFFFALNSTNFPLDRFLFYTYETRLDQLSSRGSQDAQYAGVFGLLSILLYTIGYFDLPSTGKYLFPQSDFKNVRLNLKPDYNSGSMNSMPSTYSMSMSYEIYF